MQYILQNLRKDSSKLWSVFLDFGKLVGLRIEPYRFSALLPSITAFLQGCITEFLTACKRPLHQSRLFAVGIEPILEREPRHFVAV